MASRVGMFPFMNVPGLVKPPAPPRAPTGSGSSDPQSAESAAEGEILSIGAGKDLRHNSSSSWWEGQSVVMVATDANVKEISHAGIVWAMQHVLKRGDILLIFSVLDYVRGSWGYKTKIGDPKWQSANQKFIEEIKQKMEAWRGFAVLDQRCTEGGVKLVVMVKVAQRGDLTICQEAMKLGARHVVLDRSLRTVRREFFLQNLSCDVTRMRRSGGVDPIRPSADVLADLMPRLMKSPPGSETGPHSPTSDLSSPRLSYSDQIDEFGISLGSSMKFKREVFPSSKSAAAPTPPKYPSGNLEFGKLSRHPPSSPSLSEHSNPLSPSGSSAPSLASGPYFTSSFSSGESKSSNSSQRFPSSPILAERSSTSTLSRWPSSSGASFRGSEASGRDTDDEDLFSIFHGSTRHSLADNEGFSNLGYGPRSSGYESDDLFSITNGSSRSSVVMPDFHLGHRLSSSSLPDFSMIRTSRRSSTENIPFTPSVTE